MRNPAGSQYEPNKSRQGGHKHQIPNKSQITITNTRRTRPASACAAGAPALRVTKTIKAKRIN
jgi:hypothetical protein